MTTNKEWIKELRKEARAYAQANRTHTQKKESFSRTFLEDIKELDYDYCNNRCPEHILSGCA